MGHTRSNDLVKAFNDGFNELDLTKLVQISNGRSKFKPEIFESNEEIKNRG